MHCTPITMKKEDVMGAPAYVLVNPKGERIAFGTIEDALYRLAKHFNGDQEHSPVLPGHHQVLTLKKWVEKFMLEANRPVGRKQLLEAALRSGRTTTMGGVSFYLTKLRKDGKIRSLGKGMYEPTGKR